MNLFSYFENNDIKEKKEKINLNHKEKKNLNDENKDILLNSLNKKNSYENNEINISTFKELDEKIFQLKKEIDLLDNMENFVEQSSLIFFKEEENDKEIYEKAQNMNKEFYDEIEEKLQMAEEALNFQFIK